MGEICYIRTLTCLITRLVSRQVHMAEPGDYHEAGFRLCLALNSGYSILSTGGNGVTFVLFTLGTGLTLDYLGQVLGLPLYMVHVPGEAG